MGTWYMGTGYMGTGYKGTWVHGYMVHGYMVKILGSGEHFWWKVPIGLHGLMGAKFKVQTTMWEVW